MLCKECGKNYRGITSHLKKTHKMSILEYVKTHNEDIFDKYSRKKFKYFNCKICGNDFSLIWSKDNFYIKNCNKCKSTNILKRWKTIFGEQEGYLKYKDFIKKTRFSKKMAIEKYGEVEGNRKIDHWVSSCKQNKEGFIKRHGKKLGLEKFKQFCDKSKITKQKFIMKYGVDGEILYELYCKNKTKGWKSALNHYLLLGYSFEEAKKLQSKYQKWTCSKERYLEKYGKKKGTIFYNELRKKQLESFGRKSNIENQFLEEIVQILNLDKEAVYFGDKQWFCNIDRNFCLVDFYDRYFNIVIEFYGDYWHANPKKYNNKDIFIINKNIIYAEDIWNKDNFRKTKIEEHLGCKFIVIWESDWLESKVKIIELIKKIYLGEINENKED